MSLNIATNNPNCLFCQIIINKIDHYKIYENEFIYAFLDLFPLSKGHVLIITKHHFSKLTTTIDNELEQILIAGKKIALKIKAIFNPLGFNYLINEAKIASQTVFHTHLHLIPKYSQNDGLFLKRSTIDQQAKNNLLTIQKKIAF